MQDWIEKIEYNKEDEKPKPITISYFCNHPQFKYTETCIICGNTFYTPYKIEENGGIVKRVCNDKNECLYKFQETYRFVPCSICRHQSWALKNDYTKEQIYEDYSKEEWDKKRDETKDCCPLCGRTYNNIKKCVICGKTIKTNYSNQLLCENIDCKDKLPAWKREQKIKKKHIKRKNLPICSVEGCTNFRYNKHKYCWKHYAETQPAYADNIKKAVRQWLEYNGYDVITNESLRFDVSACRKKEYPTGEIIGIEIKSDHDHYTRLQKQMLRYLDVFDKVYLCIDNKKTYNYPSVGILRFENGYITVEKEAVGRTREKKYSQYDIAELLKISNLSVYDSIKIDHTIDLVEKLQRKIRYIALFKKSIDNINDLVEINNEEKHLLKHLVNF